MSTLTTHRAPRRGSPAAGSIGVAAVDVRSLDPAGFDVDELSVAGPPRGACRRVSRRAPRRGGRTTAVRPAGVRRPAAGRIADGRVAGARRFDDGPGAVCPGNVRGADVRLVEQRSVPRVAALRRVGVDGGDIDRRSSLGRPVGDPPLVVRPDLRRPAGRVASAAAARSVRRPATSAPVRLTRRGRAVVLLVALGITLAVLTVVGPHSAATGDGGAPVRTRTVEVAPGDTLWGIASDVTAPGHVRDMVHQIEQLNALSGPSVSVGEQIAVPVG